MKKLFFISALLFLINSLSLAQKNSLTYGDTSIPKAVIKKKSRYFLNVHGGYAFGLGSTFKFYPDNVSSINVTQVGSTTPSRSVVYSSPTKGLGQGFRYGVGVSYIVNDFISLGLDLDYFKSSIIKNRDSSFTRTKIAGSPNGMDELIYNERTRTSYDATLLTLSPNIIFKAISLPKWYLYNKLGAVITFRPNSTQKDVLTTRTQMGWQGFIKDSTSNNAKTYEWGIRNPAFGFMAGVGAQFRLSQKLRFYTELQFSHIVFVVRNRKTTEYKLNNVDMLNTLPLSVRQIDFSTSYTDNQQNPNPNMPSRAITERIPITYLGIQAGISYKF